MENNRVMTLEKSTFLSDKVEVKERTRIPTPATAQICFKTSKTNDRPSSILFEFENATIIKSFNYINLYSKHYDRNIGILLFYTNATVTIYGNQLDKLFLALNEGKVTSINEFQHRLRANDEVHNPQMAMVTTIEVKYKDTDIEKDIERLEINDFTEYDEVG